MNPNDAHFSHIRDGVKDIKRAYSIGGSVSLPHKSDGAAPLRVNFLDKTCVDFPVSDPETGLNPLLKACQPAEFGVNSKSVLDKDYRDALQLQASDFTINFNLAEHGILAQIRRLMVPHLTDIRAELYNINVYKCNGHFKSHRDTPRKDMFGSLVVCLPSDFKGGKMLVRHNDTEQVYDWGSEQISSQEQAHNDEDEMIEVLPKDKSSAMCHWAAFFSDCEHEITPVSSGYRVTITYNLYPVIPQEANDISQPELNSEGIFDITQQPFYKTLAEALASKDFMPNGGTLGFCMEYSYPITEDEFKDDYGRLLKGGDAIVYFAAHKLGMKLKLRAVYTDDKYTSYFMPNGELREESEDYNDGDDSEKPKKKRKKDKNIFDIDDDDDDMNNITPSKMDWFDKFGSEKKTYLSTYFIKGDIAHGEEEPGFDRVVRSYLNGKDAKNVVWIIEPTIWERGLSSGHYGNCPTVDVYYVAAAMLLKVPEWGKDCRMAFDHGEDMNISS